MESLSCKNIVIVGNGSSSLNNKNGSFIDTCDIVIRIKDFTTEGFEQFVGTKTDIWCTKWFCYKPHNVKTIWLPFIDPHQPIADNKIKLINNFLLSNQFEDKKINMVLHDELVARIGKSNVLFLTEKELIKSMEELKLDGNVVYTKSGSNVCHPTTYLTSILVSQERFPDHKIYVTGCDGFKKGYYWNKSIAKHLTKTWPHQYDREILYIKKLLLTNQIIPI
jgi:hypothetical protein